MAYVGRKYHTFKLVKAFRTQRGSRQRDVLNLGSRFSLPRDQWKALADRVETIMTGQCTSLPVSKKIEALAQRYAKEIISKQGQVYEHSGESAVETDYHTVDVNSVDSEHIRSVGGESVVLDSIKYLELDRKLEELGLSRVNVNAAIGVITGRLLVPSSERATHIWLQNQTALDDLLGTSFAALSQDRVYKFSDLLLKNKAAIEWDHEPVVDDSPHAVYPPPSDDVDEARGWQDDLHQKDIQTRGVSCTDLRCIRSPHPARQDRQDHRLRMAKQKMQ